MCSTEKLNYIYSEKAPCREWISTGPTSVLFKRSDDPKHADSCVFEVDEIDALLQQVLH